MGYKRDINLFKAAGGQVAKGKKMPITKKLLIALVLVVIVMGGVIGLLMYLQSGQNANLEALQTQNVNYERTKRATTSLLGDYANAKSSKDVLSFIEYYNELESHMFSIPEDSEIDKIKTLMRNSGYTTDFYFDDVAQEIKRQVLLAPYSIDSNRDDAATLIQDYMLLYNEIVSMIDYGALFQNLYGQSELGTWYSYFRGQMVMVVKATEEGGIGADSLIQGLIDPDQLQAAPFMNLVMSTDSGQDRLYEAVGMDVSVEGDVYTIVSITRKTYVERLFDIIEETVELALENEDDQTGIDYSYTLGNLSIIPSDGRIEFRIRVVQSDVFGLEQIVTALNYSAFFKAADDLVFDYIKGAPTQEANLAFDVRNPLKANAELVIANLFKGQN